MSALVFDLVFSNESMHAFKLLKEAVELTEKPKSSKSEIMIKVVQCLTLLKNYLGETFITIKAHMLEHKAEDYDRFGPNWTHSSFGMEDYGGDLLRFKISNNNFEEHLCKSIILREEMQFLQKLYVKSQAAQKLLNTIHPPKSTKGWEIIDDTVQLRYAKKGT